MSQEKFDSYKQIFQQELQNILSYWTSYAIDEEHGGFYGAVDLDNRPVPDAEKSAVLNARILWTFAAAALHFENAQYGRVAQRAYQVLTNQFHDGPLGGYYSTLSAQGRPKDKTKHAYYQAFVLYAFCQYQRYMPTRSKMERIQNLFKLFEDNLLDPILPGYRESFYQNWQIHPQNYIAGHHEAKTMNTHLHILEAFAALYQIWPAPLVQRRLREMLHLFLHKIMRPDGHLGSFFDRHFQESKQSTAVRSFGHDIEASWLLLEAADILGDAQIRQQTEQASLKLLQAVIQSGLDQDGGLFLESTHHGRKTNPVKWWWPQAEALVAFLNGYQLSGDPIYWQHFQSCWEFIQGHFIDHEKGEWFARLDKHGRPLADAFPTDCKINPWKSPYHNGRACLQIIRRLEALEKAAVPYG